MTRNHRWFEEWFDSPYYQVLYGDRNSKEASDFLDNLIPYLSPRKSATFLDIACGTGRHSVHLHSLGYKVVGFDLSDRNIEEASLKHSEGLSFHKHDMRKPFSETGVDYALNLFTSFGYFENNEENVSVLQNIYNSLRAGGKFVLDYLNPAYVSNHLVKKEVKTTQGISFEINRFVEGKFICKRIEFGDEWSRYSYTEKVRAIGLNEFLRMFKSVGFQVQDVFGSYNLRKFDSNGSDRMIFVSSK